MKLSIVHAGLFKLDGGAMFGVVPKVLWNKKNPADENNQCLWSMQSLLIEHGDRKILVDCGIGSKQDDKFRSHFTPHGPEINSELNRMGVSVEDITDVFLTHMHFDHVGGAVSITESGELYPTYPNATYWSTEKHYQVAINPNVRERASFLKENILPLKDHDRLKFIEEKQSIEWLPGIHIDFVHGHTDSMMILNMELDSGKRAVYCADLLASHFHIGLPYIMGYDLRPLETLKEKEILLSRAVERGDVLIYEHDPKIEASTITKNNRGRFVVGDTGKLSQFL